LDRIVHISEDIGLGSNNFTISAQQFCTCNFTCLAPTNGVTGEAEVSKHAARAPDIRCVQYRRMVEEVLNDFRRSSTGMPQFGAAERTTSPPGKND
jgi:hypothetical protein